MRPLARYFAIASPYSATKWPQWGHCGSMKRSNATAAPSPAVPSSTPLPSEVRATPVLAAEACRAETAWPVMVDAQPVASSAVSTATTAASLRTHMPANSILPRDLRSLADVLICGAPGVDDMAFGANTEEVMRSVVVVGFEGIQALDLVGPFDVFTGATVGLAAAGHGDEGYEVSL